MIKLPSDGSFVLGVDPGLSGAVVKLGYGKVLGARRDFKTQLDICNAIKDLYQPGDLCVLERVHSMPGEGVCSVFSFGSNTGVAKGTIMTLTGKPPLEVSPQRWQNAFKLLLGIDKKTKFKTVTREVATRLFPDAWELFTRKKDHGTSDAALIAAYGVLTPP